MTCVQEVGKEETDEVEEVRDEHVGAEEDYGACREILDDHVSVGIEVHRSVDCGSVPVAWNRICLCFIV